MMRLASLGAVFILSYMVISPNWSVFLLSNFITNIQSQNSQTVVISDTCEYCQPLPETIVFTGDLLLARHVERLATINNDRYSFSYLKDILSKSDVVVTNFEASIPTKHIATPDFTVKFSVPYRLAALLPEYNIQFASLANNHSYDFDEAGYINTKIQLDQAGTATFGHPNRIDDTSIAYSTLLNGTVAIIGIHTLYRQPTQAEIINVFAKASLESDWQVAYVHWGNEYELVHSAAQRDLAERLVAAGADVVIGHHPHVVQDIAVVDGVPIFYSLGNFIFDQYFSDSVQEGLLVRLRFNSTKIEYELVPVTSKYSTAQPRLMSKEESANFISRLRDRSKISMSDQLLVGLQPAYGLATSTQISIMTE